MNLESEFKSLQLDYLDVLVEQLNEVEQILNEETQDQVKKLFRYIHTIKGTAGTYGFSLVSIAANQIEDILERSGGQLDEKGREDILMRLDRVRDFVDAFKKSDQVKVELLIRETQDDTTVQNAAIKHKVLIIENSRVQKKIIAKKLQEIGLHVSYAKDSFSALKRLVQEKFDSIICSMEVEGIDGLSFIRAQKVIKSFNQKVPNILISSSEMDAIEGEKPDYFLLKNSSLLEELSAIYEKIIHKNEDRSADNTGALPRKVMLVDDDKSICFLFEKVVEKSGEIELLVVNSGKEALIKVRDFSPDFILLDYNLEDMKGSEILKEFRETLKLNTKVCFLTAEEDTTNLSPNKYQGVIPKPFVPTEIISQIQKIYNNS